MNKLNIYQKINIVKKELLTSKIKKSGKNGFAGFNYFELSDFLPVIINKCKELELFTQTSFLKDKAILKIINIENPNEVLEYESPFIELKSYKYKKFYDETLKKTISTGEMEEDLSGMNSIQKLGASQTYIRRYLLLMAFDIIENDTIDAIAGNKDFEEITFEDIKEKLLMATCITNIDNIKSKYNLKMNKYTKEQKQELLNIINNKKEMFLTEKVKKEQDKLIEDIL